MQRGSGETIGCNVNKKETLVAPRSMGMHLRPSPTYTIPLLLMENATAQVVVKKMRRHPPGIGRD
ncbi:expressed unknown protein [Ectocarpus siliculosus]|uniref:Uncharacterized protein n=1 Tax=Ectocarpus siliculosus TaxID=2880 RepID=D7FLB5_ECTSI|nr:expressed unknown protein [Ectocarpus siliculosus]|eukprot:CBJ34227.1 expressed unknown protein [Ectocarpus siliculosus]